ncbi:ABC transporter permease [Spirosoma validum]|uniref:ABC transporter permease n=1 Tax=Spirosoma validum TaxID=2771355 RepID=A0A927GDS8_9BACT|nr:ABC transporter permease [Spirosoma validum]MBD2754044.1 ABC transporter permease [Spirosoma validum]
MNHLSICSLIFLGICFSLLAKAQPSYDITDKEPALYNGIEYGYSIRSELKKDIGNKGTFKRYEVTFYVTNKSGCTRLFFPRQTTLGLQNQDLMANFDCVNATGARLTSKTATVRARPFLVPYSTTTKNAEGKEIVNTVQVQAGHMLENGETVTNHIVVIVPDGEQPRMRVRIQTPESNVR